MKINGNNDDKFLQAIKHHVFSSKLVSEGNEPKIYMLWKM